MTRFFTMEIEVNLSENNSALGIRLIPYPSDFLFAIFKGIKILNIEKIFITVFNENEDNDIYINTDNFTDIIGAIDTIDVLADYLQKYDYNDYLIYKLVFQTEDISVFYDDDALLILEIKMESIDETLNYARTIINQYVSTSVNVENIGLLYD